MLCLILITPVNVYPVNGRSKSPKSPRISMVLFLDFMSKQYTKLAWRSSSVMDCHATARVSIPRGNGVNTELHVLGKGQ